MYPCVLVQEKKPFDFRHVKVLRGPNEFDDSGPCVMMATPSMLQSGLSRDLFEAWCEDKNNTVIIADFAVQGTLARDILSNPSHVITKTGVKVREGGVGGRRGYGWGRESDGEMRVEMGVGGGR